MFNARIQDSKVIRDSMDVVSQIIDEGLFKINSEGIKLVATDRAKVAVIDFSISSSLFEKYEIDNEILIGLNLINFLSVLKRSSGPMEIKTNTEEGKLDITLLGDSTRKFSIPIIDISSEEIPPVSQLEFPASVEVKSNVVEDGISDADIIADSVVFEVDGAGMKMRAEGDNNKTELNIEKGSGSLVNIQASSAVRSRYPIDYLKKFIKASKIADTTVINFGNDYPMKMEFKGNNVYLAMVLAPRVEDN